MLKSKGYKPFGYPPPPLPPLYILVSTFMLTYENIVYTNFEIQQNLEAVVQQLPAAPAVTQTD